MSRYPYRFLDVDQISTAEVVISIVVIAEVLDGLGLLSIWGERRRDRRAARTSSA